jgi:hypothetical protein
MPIIINEIVFKGTIAEAGGPKAAPSPAPPRVPQIDRETLIQLCVEEVLRILERQKER